MRSLQIKHIFVFTFLMVMGCSTVFSQKKPKNETTEEFISKLNKRKYGIRVAYGPILFPKRDTLAYYQYSQAYNVSFCTEKISKRNPLNSSELSLGYGIFDFKERISSLDTNVTVKPYVSKKFNDVFFTYDQLFFQFNLKVQLNSHFIFGYGWNASVFFLRKKGGYEPLTFAFWEKYSNGVYSKTTVTRDYTYDKSFFNLYLNLNAQFRIDRNHSIGLNVSFNPYDFVNISMMRSMPTYPLKPADGNRKILGGPSFESVFITLFYYRVMF